MKLRIFCLITILVLCMSMLFVACKPDDQPDETEVDQGKKGEIVTKGAEGDANINVPGKITDNFTLPY